MNRIRVSKPRAMIYQLMIRTFGNVSSKQYFDGSIVKNGCGKFADINELALLSIRELGFNTIWLTGILEQASSTSYLNRAADPPEILKGKAGSPYAIRDYFDVCPDYAVDPANRLAEFRELLARCRALEIKVIIDFVPNHVARTYHSDVHPELSFGLDDKCEVFFDRDNHFFYLSENDLGNGPPLRLPSAEAAGGSCVISSESEYGRVTGNNAITWQPSIHDWYETVKLNYGHDFTTGRQSQHLPSKDAEISVVPKTWRTMDEIIAYWQGFGVDGFRADMAHMVPMEFWRWLVNRARLRDPDVVFLAEAYDGDPAKLTDSDVLDELLEAGFDASYEHPTYKILQGIYESGKWANDIDRETFVGERFHRCVRYIENHDEVRIAHPKHWGGVGMNAGRPAAAVMYGMSRATIMLYAGQEVGEPAIGEVGFSKDDGRTSIFDYTIMPEFQKWVNQGAYDGALLSSQQCELRSWYADLLSLLREPAFTDGDFYGLNHANLENENFGRLNGEIASGHWLYAFLRHDISTNQSFLCVVNFHPTESLMNVRIQIPEHAFEFMGYHMGQSIRFTARLGSKQALSASCESLVSNGLEIGSLEPFGVIYYELI
jgi:glycosidase